MYLVLFRRYVLFILLSTSLSLDAVLATLFSLPDFSSPIFLSPLPHPIFVSYPFVLIFLFYLLFVFCLYRNISLCFFFSFGKAKGETGRKEIGEGERLRKMGKFED
jgi:hypothetical protein